MGASTFHNIAIEETYIEAELLNWQRGRRLMVWLRNFRHIHHRMMARFLRKRGWVVFYLEEQVRECKGMCWLKLYKTEEITHEIERRSRRLRSPSLDG